MTQQAWEVVTLLLIGGGCWRLIRPSGKGRSSRKRKSARRGH